jgi:SAM-dependent methyltransferase
MLTGSELSKVFPGEFMTERGAQNKRSCPACQSDAGRPVGQKNGIMILSCKNCGTLYAADYSESSNSQDYDSYYDEHNLSVPAFIRLRLKEIVGHFAPFRRTNRLLDIGSGSGVLLESARAAGWEAEGLEVSRRAVEHARERGFTVFHGELEKAGYPDAHFDVVTASEILEHVSDPQAMVKEISRILRAGGLFWATTPHGRGISARLLKTGWSVVHPPEHLHLFSLRGMRNLLELAGFSRPHVLTHGVNPIEILNSIRSRRRDQNNGAAAGGNGRVESSYRLNEKLTKSQFNRAVKAALNGGLGITKMGDSLKVWAVK